MSAIEVYVKIMDAVKDADLKDIFKAMQFAQQEINDKYWATQTAVKELAYANECSTGLQGTIGNDARAEAIAIVRAVVNEELAKTKTEGV